MMYVLYIKDSFDKEWHYFIGFSKFKSELYAWLEVNWIQLQGGRTPVVEYEGYYRRKLEKGDFT